jgi:hypothetical protein
MAAVSTVTTTILIVTILISTVLVMTVLKTLSMGGITYNDNAYN